MQTLNRDRILCHITKPSTINEVGPNMPGIGARGILTVRIVERVKFGVGVGYYTSLVVYCILFETNRPYRQFEPRLDKSVRLTIWALVMAETRIVPHPSPKLSPLDDSDNQKTSCANTGHIRTNFIDCTWYGDSGIQTLQKWWQNRFELQLWQDSFWISYKTLTKLPTINFGPMSPIFWPLYV